MNFTDVFIRRPVFASVLSLLLLLIGLRACSSLSVREYPKISVNAINVTVKYPGANAALMEGFVTTPIENALSGIDGIDYITSASTYGQSQIVIYMKMGTDINLASTDITNKVSSVRWQLPKGIYDPIIDRSDPNASPTLFISFACASMSGEELTDYLLRVVQPQLQVLPGTGQVQVWSANKYGMRIWLNPYAMAARNVTANDVGNALKVGNVRAASGKVDTNWQELTINTASDANTERDFENLIVRDNNGQLTRLRDISRIQLGSAITDITVDIDGKLGVIVAVTPQTDANPLDVSNSVKQSLKKMEITFPKDMKYSIMIDVSKYIDESINQVKSAIWEAAFFVIIIVFMFLGSIRSLMIPLVTIPLSLIGVFGVMLALQYSLNTMTFLALVLAIGLVVDDAIVVLENIYRHISMGKTPFEAAIDGAREIQFAILSITFTLAAVYAPIGFMSGLTGALFREFAFTLAASVVISGFLALTLSPMMCSKIITSTTMSGFMAKKAHHYSDLLMHGYKSWLNNILHRRKLMFSILAVMVVACWAVYQKIPSELAPREDPGYIMVFVTSPSSANIQYTQRYTDQMIPIFESIPEADHYGIVNGYQGVNTSMAFLSLKPWDKRKRTVDRIVGDNIGKFLAIPGILAFPTNPFNLPGASSYHPVEVDIQTLGSYNELNTITQALLQAIHANPKIINADSNLKLDKPQLDVNIDRDKAGDLGIPLYDISTAINLAFGEPETTNFAVNGRKYDVIPQLDAQYRNSTDLVNTLQLHTSHGSIVPLSNVVQLSTSVRPRTLNHFQQLRAATITADLMPGYTIGEALDYIKAQMKTTVPHTMSIDYGGQSRQFLQTSGTMTVTLFFAIIFIFLILAAQFESFRDPFVVIFTVPLSTFGALLVLMLTNSTLNIYSQIGLVTLIGLISKHGILMVEFANQLQEAGKSVEEAIMEAATLRLRPILMTTAAMILGSLPLALAAGAGAAGRQQIGITIVGGMSIGTIFTLFVIPTMYIAFATRRHEQKTS
ncbi:MAG: efflux RND transporter permease subunit [Gammaproteobacteria bacterium]